MDQVFSRVLAVLLLVVTATFANTLYFQPKTEMVCPDNKHSCTSDTTCCLLPDGEYGCCMYANAVCCSDNIHCCPTGSYCDVNTGSCDKDGVKFEWSKKAPAALYVPKEKMESNPVWLEKVPPMSLKFQQPASIPWAKKLPGLKVNSLNISTLQLPVSCSVSQTLCKSDNGLSGCCPFPNAMCCEKTQLCCPSGFQCNLKSSKCEKPTEETTKEMETLTSGRTLFALRNPVVCPDITTTCPENFTCCLGKDSYACCAFSSATCCSDREHCCPNGYICDVSADKCVKKKVDMILVKMTKWKSQQLCPDMETSCPKDSTCCPLDGGSYGCCPYPKAVCCSDNYHCCPRGYTCDVKASKCQIMSQGLTCPDHQTHCSSGMTCCQIEEHVYGCCPFPQAKCCSDMKHCCPSNFICDPIRGRCRIEAPTKKFSLISLSVANVSCPDSHCPSGSTCCPVSSTKFGCCPLPKAVCCQDNKHCCPKNFHCDLEHERCVMGQTSLPLYRKFLPSKSLTAMKVTKKISKSVMCPDNNECPDHNTCCLMDNGGWGCCPYLNAVCCIDRRHCCPESFSCDMKTKKCISVHSSINPIFSMFTSKMKPLKKIPSKSTQ